MFLFCTHILHTVLHFLLSLSVRLTGNLSQLIFAVLVLVFVCFVLLICVSTLCFSRSLSAFLSHSSLGGLCGMQVPRSAWEPSRSGREGVPTPGEKYACACEGMHARVRVHAKACICVCMCMRIHSGRYADVPACMPYDYERACVR